MAKNSKFYMTSEKLGSHIMGNDRLSKRLAFTQVRASGHYRGGLTQGDKQFIVLVRNYLHQYGFTLATGSKTWVQSSMRLKNRLQAKGVLVGHPIEIRASVISYLLLKEGGRTTLRRHSKITGIPTKKLSKLGRRYARLMENPQIFTARSNKEMIGDTLDLMIANGVYVDTRLREMSHLMSDYISTELDKHDMPYRNSTNAAVIWITSKMEDCSVRQTDICSVNEVTAQTVRGTLRNTLYPLFNFNKKSLTNLTVEEFVAGIRRNEKEE